MLPSPINPSVTLSAVRGFIGLLVSPELLNAFSVPKLQSVKAKVKVRFDQQTHKHFELTSASADIHSRRD
jgi:hypothetical protein